MNNLLKVLPQQATQSGMITRAWSSQEWKTDTEMCERSGRPDVTSWWKTQESQPGFSHEETEHDGTEQSVVNEVIPRERSGRPDVDPQRGARPQQFIIGNDETELELSVESRSFVNRGEWSCAKKDRNDTKCCRRWRETFYFLENVHDCNNGISSIHGKELPEQKSVHHEHNRSHTQTNVRQICKDWCLSKMRSLDWKQLVGKIIHGNTCPWLVMKELSIFNAQRKCLSLFIFRVVSWQDSRKLPIERCMWTKIGMVKNSLKITETLTESTVSQWNSSGISSQDSIRCSSMKKSKVTVEIDESSENFTGRIIFMSMFNDISCGSKDNEKECLANAKLVSLQAKRFGKGPWSFIGLGSEKKWYCISEDSPQGVWDNMTERMLLEFAESGCPIFRTASPLSRGRLKSEGHGKMSFHYAAALETIETIFRIIVSGNQLSLYQAIAEICEEYETLHERTVRPVVMVQSSSLLMLSVIETQVPFLLWWPGQ